MAAVDIDNAAPELLEQMRESVRRIVLTEPGARLACVSVMRTARIGMDPGQARTAQVGFGNLAGHQAPALGAHGRGARDAMADLSRRHAPQPC